MSRNALFGSLLICLFAFLRVSVAADPAFVGDLALAVDEEVARQLALDEATRAKLLELIDQRESEAVSLALDIKDLTPAERQARLAPFVAESEKQGWALLTPEQRRRLQQLRIARGGLATLQQESVATAVGLNASQQAEVKTLLADLQDKLAFGTEAERRVVKAEAERRLAQVLTQEQRAEWEKLAGLSGTDDAPPATASAGEPKSTAAVPADEKTGPPADEPNTNEIVQARASPAVPPAARNTASAGAGGDRNDTRLTFNFRYTPWKDVLDWFATQADLSLVIDAPPPGTFNYSDTRSYTPAQAIDLLNSVLLTKGYTLLRRDRMLLLINLEDGIPPNLVPQVSPEELDAKGEYELVSCLFTVTRLPLEDLEADIRKLLGPQGTLVVLPKAKQLYVTETAGKLRTIRTIIESLEDPALKENEMKIASFKLENALPDEVMAAARPLMGIPENLTSTPDGSLRIAIDTLNSRFLVSGKPERVEKFGDIIKMIDVRPASGDAPTVIETPQLEVYTVTTADPDAVLQVLRTLLAGAPDVRLDKDTRTGNIVAHARPAQHATIRATIEQMQKDSRQVEVIKLRKLDPQSAVLAINKLFGVAEGTTNASAPSVDADPSSMQLLIRGSQSQIEQIRELLAKMGEQPADGSESLADRSNVRMIPLTGRSAESAIEQIESLWPAVRANKIRIVTPSDGAGAEREGASGNGRLSVRVPVPPGFMQRSARPAARTANPAAAGTQPAGTQPAAAQPAASGQPAGAPNTAPQPVEQQPAGERRGDGNRDDNARGEFRRGVRTAQQATAAFHFVAWQENAAEAEQAKPAESAPNAAEQPADSANDEPAAESESDANAKQKTVPGAEIVITVGPGGIVVASEDLDALDEFEEMLRSVAEQTRSSGKEYTIFYLRYAKADLAAELLQQALGGGSGGSGDGGDGGLVGDLASSMLGNMGGGLLGGLMAGGDGGGSASSGPVMLVPDTRLNAIIAQGRPADLDMAQQLLEIIDQEESPEDVQTTARPRFIPVVNTTAAEMATIVRQVYSGRIAADANQPRQPSPEELIRALRGGRGGGGRGGNDRKAEEQKMTIGVDERSNSLIVAAPEALFNEVKLMVEQLDVAGAKTDEAVRVVSLKRANPLLVEQALNSMVGNVTVNRQGTSTSTQGRQGNNRGQGQQPQTNGGQSNQQNRQMQQEIQQRIEAFNQFQQRGGRGGRRGR
jgi:type II secretory pathway component GspD/PulD (secretin)